ncbi:MAG: hypothetical protein Q7J27_02915 [Syntrophales bacterium]|nr:hypothetical protein [Syntrophales bacterium]
MKTCKKCFREFEEDVLNISPAMELVDYLDSRFHGNDRGETDIGEGINDLCPEYREESGVMNLQTNIITSLSIFVV